MGLEHQFNLETAARASLDGDKTARIMRDDKRFGPMWDKFSLKEQDKIISLIAEDESDDEILIEKFTSEYNVSAECAENIINSPLEGGCIKFGRTVIDAILPEMENGILEHEAIANCGWHHSYSFTGEVFDELPYYGKILELLRHYLK